MFEITLSLHLLKHNETLLKGSTATTCQMKDAVRNGNTAVKEATKRQSVPNFEPLPDSRNVMVRDVNLAS